MEMAKKYLNESLKAIVTGLDVQPGDNILSVASTGDQIFSMLEKGASVHAYDLSNAQLEHINYRIKLLNEGKSEEFIGGRKNNFSKFIANRDSRREYFESISLEDIKNNLGNLKFLGFGNIYDVEGKENFDKFYLSNSLAQNGERDEFVKDKLHNFSKGMNKDSLIYACSDWSDFNFRDIQGLSIDDVLSNKAQMHEGRWTVKVFRKD